MPDIRLTAITNDVKSRNIMEMGVQEFSGLQFLEAMTSGMGASSYEPNTAKKTSYRDAEKITANKASHRKENEPVTVAAQERAEVTNKIKTRLKEIADKDTTPVKDTKPLKTLEKAAKALLKAEKEGQIELPPEMIVKLEEFIAKGDDFRAFDIANFMNEFIDMFRGINVPLTPDAQAQEFTWPKEVVAAFEDLGMPNSAFSADKPLTTLDILRTVKSLVNDSQKAAITTLDENAQNVLSDDNAAGLLLAGAAVDTKQRAESFAKPAEILLTPTKPIAFTAAKNTPDLSTVLPTTDVESGIDNAVLKPLMDKQDLSFGVKEKPVAEASPPPVLAVKAAMEAASPQQTPNAPPDLKAMLTASVAQPALQQQVKVDAAGIATQGVTGIENLSFTGVPLTGAKAVMPATAAQAATNAAQQTASPVQQVIVNIQQKINKTTQLSIQLTPVELGQVEIRLDIKRNGQAHAIIMVEKPETLALLQKDASQLEKALQQSGINTSAENMNFSMRDDRNAQQFNQQSRKRFSREAITEKIGTDIALNVLPGGQIFSDTQINYHA